MAPAGTPDIVVQRLNLEVNKALALPDVAAQMATEGATPMALPATAFAALIAQEIPRWAEVVRAGNVKAE